MNNNIIIKSLTLLLFTSLVTGFITYRAGLWGNSQANIIPSSPNGSALNNTMDSIPIMNAPPKESDFIIPSSKALILDDFKPAKKDSIPAPKPDSLVKLRPFIYSSKSGRILEPFDLKELKLDTITQDSIPKK